MAKGGKIRKIVIGVLATVLFLGQAVSAQVTDQQRLAELQKRRDELAKEIEKARTGAEGKRKEITRLGRELEIITADIRKTELKIIETQQRIREAEVQISQLTDKIGQKERELKIEEDNQDEAVRNLYETTAQDPLFLAFGDSVSAAVDQAAAVEGLEIRIEIVIDEIKRLREELQTQRKLAQDKEAQLKKLKLQHEQYKTGLNQQKNHKSVLLTDSEQQKKEFEKQLEAARRAYQDTTSELYRITQAARARAAAGPPRRVANVEFQRPVPGVITTHFGEPTYVQAFHTGEDEDCVMREPVFAISDATITFTGGNPSYGYGNYIDSQVEGLSDYSWRVAHLSGFAVSVGERVKRGDLVGFCGNTGFAYAFHPLGDGTHVHSEVRVLGVPVDPALCCFP